MDKSVDIIIIGGGLTGASLLAALQNLGVNALLIDAKPFPKNFDTTQDARALALSPASWRILAQLGVWKSVQKKATAINLIHVSEQYNFGISRIEAATTSPLGYVVEAQLLNSALYKILNKKNVISLATVTSLDLVSHQVTVTTDRGEKNITAKLIVAADGSHSTIRNMVNLPVKIKYYNQDAIVANIGLNKPHNGIAYERFTTYGPLALLPMAEDHMSLVWSLNPEKAQQLMNIPEVYFLKELHLNFGYRLGRFINVSKRHCYTLKQYTMAQQIKWPVVFIGNAAHTLHPVAGQGFNLGLRDVATLVQCIEQYGLNEDMLKQYIVLREQDQQTIISLTNDLIKIFAHSWFVKKLPGANLLRSMGLITFDNLSCLKDLLTRYAMGFGGHVPDFACD